MDKNIKYIPFTPKNGAAEHMDGLIECYRNVFGSDPWNEWKKCTICGRKWGLSKKKELRSICFIHCSSPIVDFWSREIVFSDICKEISAEASCWLTLHKTKIIGFCWGYPITPKNLEVKLELDGLTENMRQAFGDTEVVGYQDEIGVIKEHRGNGFATEMFFRRLEDFKKQGLEIGVVRTMSNPPTVTFEWFKSLGYIVISQYHDADGRVIMAIKLNEIKNITI